MKKSIYIITGFWHYENEGGSSYQLYSSYKKAKKAFDILIHDEKENNGLINLNINNNNYKIAYSEQDIKEIKTNYVLEVTNETKNKNPYHYWAFYEANNYYNCHFDYKLEKREIE